VRCNVEALGDVHVREVTYIATESVGGTLDRHDSQKVS
jgi:hypothetical protein